VANRINITCGHCNQVLSVDPAAAGQQVQCPKCQQRSVIPAARPAPSQPAARQISDAKPTATKLTVNCPKCALRMTVKATDKPAVVRCPKCKIQVKIPAAGTASSRPSTPSGNVPKKREPAAASKPPSPQSASLSGTKQPVSATGSSDNEAVTDNAVTDNAVMDLGQLDVGPAEDPLSSPLHRPRPVKRKSGSVPGAMLRWANNHRWITTIIVLNLLPLLVAIKFPPILALCIFNVPIGAVIIGLLLVPRQHIVKRVLEKFGAQLASVGAGGVAIVIVVVLVKALPRLANRVGNNPNLDFSNMGAIVGSLMTTFITLAIFLAFWRMIGIARLLAAAYCFQLSIMTLLLWIGSASLPVYDSGYDSTIAFNTEPDPDPTSGFQRSEQRRREARERAAELRRQAGANQSTVVAVPADGDPGDVSARGSAIPSAAPSGRPIAIDPTLPSGDAMEARIAAFRQRNSSDNTVVIKVVRKDETDAPRDVRLQLQQALGLNRHFFSMFGDQALMLFVHEGPVSEVAAKLTMGEVLSMDEAERTIEFRIDDL